MIAMQLKKQNTFLQHYPFFEFVSPFMHTFSTNMFMSYFLHVVCFNTLVFFSPVFLSSSFCFLSIKILKKDLTCIRILLIGSSYLLISRFCLRRNN